MSASRNEPGLQRQELDARVRAFEERLRREWGLDAPAVRHFKRVEERPFTAEERPRTTILYGGLTLAHETILQGALEGLGYRAEPLPCPDNQALAVGKEYGNRGQCNPTYYTVGNLVKYLQELRARGVRDIEDRYVFVTGGGCGPCRFGMYEAEYRKALRDAGFPRFRVLLFQQTAGLKQSGEGAGLELNATFFITLIKALMAGDLINDLGYRIRPYEVHPGETDRILAQARALLADTFRQRLPLWRALRRVRRWMAGIAVDYSRVKPRVKITGEFWAQTTEGDGSYRLARWLEGENAEVLVEPVATWVDYLIWEGLQYVRDRRWSRWDATGLKGRNPWKLEALLRLAQVVYRSHYFAYRAALGFRPLPLPSQRLLARLAHPYYNTRLSGGEGHMEVGKTILAVTRKKAHLVISIKPFGCMPSTQSDGVQSKVITDYPDTLFVSIETSGDSEVNVKSRVQMKLFEAKQRAREEFRRTAEAYGLTAEQAQAVLQAQRGRLGALHPLPHKAAGTAANALHSVMRRHPLRELPARIQALRARLARSGKPIPEAQARKA